MKIIGCKIQGNLLDGVRLEDIYRKIVEVDGCWILENLRDGIAVYNTPPLAPELIHAMDLAECDIILSQLDQLLISKLVMRETEILLNRGSGLTVEGAPLRVSIEGENLIAENKSGLAIRLAQKGMRLLISSDVSRGFKSLKDDGEDALQPSALDGRPVIKGRISGGEAWGSGNG